MLTFASTREDRLVYLTTLPVAAARHVVRSLLGAGMAEEVAGFCREPGSRRSSPVARSRFQAI
jgi:hypothetical protein